MRNKLTLLIAFAAVLAVSCEKSDADRLEKIGIQDLTTISVPGINLTKSEVEMTDSINAFAYDLYSQAYEEGKDIFISPFSISIALSMLTTGASGNTEAELLKLLGFGGRTAAELDAYYSKVMGNMASQDPSTTLSIANAIWSSKDIILKTQFIKDCENYFSSTAESVDFSDAATLGKLNAWVSDHTNGKIDRMFDELSPDTKTVLANALYFKAKWAFEFVRSGNRLLAKVRTAYCENDRCSIVSLPYGNGAFSLKIFLPSANSSLKEVVENLDKLNDWHYTTYETANVSLDMPAFSFSYDRKLGDDLRKMGVRDAFDPNNADFSKMTELPLYVGNVIHRAFVDVNEKGTEAAAVTAVEMECADAGPSQKEPRDVNFTVDRDFIFEIIDRSSGTVVFIGQHKM